MHTRHIFVPVNTPDSHAYTGHHIQSCRPLHTGISEPRRHIGGNPGHNPAKTLHSMRKKTSAQRKNHMHITGLRNGQHEPYALAVSLFMYRGNAGYRRIPQSLKYHGDMAAGKFFGSELGKRIAASPHFSDIDTIIPVPLHWKREWDRGYNQSLIIAREIASWTGATLKPFLLRRKKKTGTQTRLSIEEKEANVDNAFAVPERYASHVPASSHILLVDDVFTTGATLFFCFKALRGIYGPETRISVATLAVVDNG